MMKRVITVTLAAMCCILCIASLLVYAYPWGVQSVNWSLMPESGQETSQTSRDWTVYVVRDGKRIPLDTTGNGRYAGCEPGETIYCTRVWDAEIRYPVLRVHAANASIAVWIDDELKYSDTPLASEAIGEASLRMLANDRGTALEIPLDGDVYGHMLTVAQSTPMESETPGYSYVYPCDVDVASSYGYERGIISQAYLAGLAEMLLCMICILLCALACRAELSGREEGEERMSPVPTLLLALLTFARLAGMIAGTPFFSRYTTLFEIDVATCANRLSFSIMLGFLTFKCNRCRLAMGVLTVAHALSVLTALALQAFRRIGDAAMFLRFLPDELTVFFLIAALIISAWETRKGNPFFRLYLKLTLALTGVGLVIGAAYLAWNPAIWNRMLAGRVYYPVLLRNPIVWIVQGAGIAAVVILAYRQSVAAREERVFAIMRAQAVQQCYENLKQHQDEVMALRHEMKRHYIALKGFVGEGQSQRALEYLNALLEQQDSIPRVVHTDNALVNVIVGSRVALAESVGVRVELQRMHVPERLPLSDHETVSLLLNIIDNAIDAAKRTRNQPGVVTLDMHCKNGYFVFACENTLPDATASVEGRPSVGGRLPVEGATLNTHGYGLRIIEKIMEPFGSLITAQNEHGRYRVTIALPIDGAPREKSIERFKSV